MQIKPLKVVSNRNIKQLTSIYIIAMLIGSAFTGLTIADDPIFGDMITTYFDDFGSMNQNNQFIDGDLIIINVTVDNSSGDPAGEPNWVIAANNFTGEWIKVYVTDNDTGGPWGTDNKLNDSMYWGMFSVNSSQPTQNVTPGNISNLQVNVGDEIDIFENEFGTFDGDPEIAHAMISIIPMGGPGGENGSICGYIQNTSFQPIDNAIVMINRTDGPPFQSTVHTDPSGFYLFNYNLSAPGTYDVMAYKPGEYTDTTAYDNNLFSNETLWVNITLDGGGGGPGGGNGTLCGYITYQDTGSPNVGAEIFIQRTIGEFYEAWTFSNDSGYYIFDNNITQGTYQIEVSKQGEFDTITLNDYQIWENQTHWENFSVTVGGGPPPGELDNITIYGHVYQDFTPGFPVSNANVTVYTQGNPNDILNSTTTDWEGFFELTFQPNETAVNQGTDQIEILFEADGYHSDTRHQDIWWILFDNGGILEIDGIWLEKIWEINATIIGNVRDIATDTPLQDVFIIAEGDNFFHNFSQTNSQGDFSIGVIAGEVELMFEYDGYFVNGTDIIYVSEGVTDLGTIYLEEQPPYNSIIAGNLTSNGNPIPDTELILFDPLHPFEGNEKEFPRTDDNGYFEIETYSGVFYLITLAKLIGKTRDGPPLAIGGYENVVDYLVIGDNETVYHNIELNSTSPDPITIDMNFIAWNISILNMSRQISSNNKIIRMMSDIDFDGVITADEAADMEDIVNSSLTEPDFFDMEALFLSIPIQFSVDDVIFFPVQTQVEIQNLIGSTTSSTPLIVRINATYVAIDYLNLEVPLGPTIHSVEIDAYLGNPAFTSTITATFPPPYLLKNAKEELATITGYNTNQATIIPHTDPNWNDSDMYQTIPMLVGTDSPFATFNTTYYVETPFDDDADGDYDYLMGKVKFTTSQTGDYHIEGTLRTQSGIRLGSYDVPKSTTAGTTSIEVSFKGEQIYRKHHDGPYSMIFDLYVYNNDTLIWLDSITKTTAAYNASEFDKPPLHFIRIVDDTGHDTDNDGLYDYLIIVLELDVGQIDTYEFDADIGIADFSYNGDPHIAHMHKTISLHQTGIQTLNFSFDGSLIYEKQTNASIWAFIQARSFTEGHLDDIDYMTNTYHYDEFTSPPPESCNVTGSITSIFGEPLEAQLRLFNQQTFSENYTTSNATDGSYNINCRPGIYQLEAWCVDPGSNYDSHWEIIIIGSDDENETLIRNLTLLPYWHDCSWLDWHLDHWQFATGDPLHLNISAYDLQNSNLTVEIYKELRDDDFYYGEQYIEKYSTKTNDTGDAYIIINTTQFSNGQYMLRMYAANQSLPYPNCARSDAWGLQVSSLWLDFNLDKQRYKPGGTGTGTYTLRYISNNTEVIGGEYQWKIMYWDWIGEHTLDSGTFTNDISGNGSFTFDIPSDILNHGDWFDLRFTATDPNENEVNSWWGFGITTGSTIDDVSDYPVGSPGDYDGLMVNITVNVTSAGQYRLNGGLHGEQWQYICGNETTSQLTTGENNVYLFFEGEDIQHEGINGQYIIWLGLYQEGHWNELDNLEYTTTTSYNSQEFARPAISFNASQPLTYYTIGAADNYNGLIVNASIIASIPGNYSVHGNLHKREEQPGGWHEWYFVAWNRSETITINGGLLNTTVTIPIYFEGTEIYNNGQLGPYNVNFNLHVVHDEYWEDWVAGYDPETSIPYDYTQFTKPAAHIESITDNGPDINDNLHISIHVNVTDGEQGTYNINGNLHSRHDQGHMWITHSWNNTFLQNGSNTVDLIFSGESIYSMGYDGPYSLNLDLEQTNPWQWLGHREFTTDEHNYTDFALPSALFTGEHTDEGYDEDGDGFYNSILVTIPISFNDTGWYELSGELYHDDNNWWQWIAWSSNHFEITTTGVQNVTLEYSGYEILNSGTEGYYGVNIWLRKDGTDIGHLEFDTDNYYMLNQFGQPAVQFTSDSPLQDQLTNNGKKINITILVNATDLGTYYVTGHMHKVIHHPGWDEWMWIGYAETQLTITQTGLQMVNISFDTASIQSQGYDGPYTVDFDLMDDNWMQIDHIHEYQTQAYQLVNFAARPAFFTGESNDYLSAPTAPEFLKVDVGIYVNESGYYNIGGDLHKDHDWNWNFIAGNGMDQYFTTGNHTITLYFDTIEISDNIENQGLTEFDSGATFDVDIWLRRQNEWHELDHLSFQTSNIYYTSNFTSLTGGITQVTDTGYNQTGSSLYEYLNITVTINFTEAGEYELWCDLHKQDYNDWHWLGWTNQFITITDAEEINVTLQFNGEQISSSEENGPYQFYMELQNFDTRKRIDRYNGDTDAYAYDDFVGSSISFNESTAQAVGYDSDDPGSEYDYLRVTVNVTSESQTNVEFRGDLHKESTQTGWHWLGWSNNWTTIPAGTSTLNLDFDGEAIRNSEIDGPYQLRIELWDSDQWKLLDIIESLETDPYTYDNFQAASAQFNTESITDWGTPSSGPYAFLEINVSVNVSTPGDYEIMGDLHSDTNGWYWLGWANNWTYLESGDQIVKLQFDGMRIKNEEINGPYKVRLELRNDQWRTIDTVEPYHTNTYSYNDFQSSGAEIVSVSDQIIDNGDYLELNVTVNCSSQATYWLGADLHKQSGWDWQWIAWESTEETLTEGHNNLTILFSGESIYNSEIDGPYHIRLELRDTATWSEQDFIERHTTGSYAYTDFAQPSVSFAKNQGGEYLITDWGNDTDSDSLYNYLQFNITVNSSQAGTYWLHSDLHKQNGYNWNWISGKGQEISLDGTGNQVILVQFDGERISDSGQDSPYTARFEISNVNTWTRLATIDEYPTSNSYLASEFQRTSIEFIDDDTTPTDRGIGSAGDYTALEINVTINSTTGGTYWLHADLHKESNQMWQWIDWNGTTIEHTGSGEETFSIRFNGANIRNKEINGPYHVRLELNSHMGEWKQYDVIERYTTSAYDAADFRSAGIELNPITDTTADSIQNGNLRINVSINTTTPGFYEITGDLHKESGWNWQWISWNVTQIELNTTGEHTIPLIFNGRDIYESEINGPYHVRIELRDIGSWALIDTIDRYTTNSYQHDAFSAPTSGINTTQTTDYATSEYLQINLTAYSQTLTEYQFSGALHGENWEFISWEENISTISSYDNELSLQFDGTIINTNGIDPVKAYIEMRRTSDWTLIESFDYDLSGIYSSGDFGAAVTIDTGSITSNVWDADSDGYNDTLNITIDITFNAGNYELSAGLRDNTTDTYITKDIIDTTSYNGLHSITFSFDGVKIFKKGLDGPYKISFIAINKENIGEIARVTDVYITPDYSHTIFDHPSGTDGNASLSGIYSSYALNITGDSKYEYLIVNATIDVITSGIYDVYGDLYSSDGDTWVAGDDNSSITLTPGQHTIQLHFEGNDIYDSQTDGPYLLGFIIIGAEIDGFWIPLDEQSNVYTTASYDYTEFTPDSQSPLQPSNVTNIAVSNDPFSPNNDGAYDTSLITVTAAAGQTLYLNIYNSTNTIIRTGMPLSGAGTSYTATWQGKDDSNQVVPDGIYRIKVSDTALGNVNDESTETTTIQVDTAPPTGASLVIENGDQYTNSTSVDLTTITATDNSTIKMRFKNAAGNWTSWETFQSSRSWTLTSTDGQKTVYYEAKDVAGNTIISPITATINLDTTKPSNVNITITGKGDTTTTYTNDVSVTLSIQAEDATSNIEEMIIAKDMAFTDRNWEDYDTSKEWTLTSGDGTKTVYIKVKDSAGKISNIYSDTIILDTTAPTGLSILINSDQDYTNQTNATLSLSATGAAKMRFSNNGTTWTNWESYTTERDGWSLPSGAGTKTVYFQAKDTAGNIATNVTDEIILDTTGPTISSITSSGIAQTTATITWTTNEAATTQVEYGTTTAYGTLTTINTSKITSHSQSLSSLTPGTTYHYRVRSKDSAGNERVSSENTFSTSSGSDTTPPPAISGLVIVDKENAEKTLTLTWNQSSASDFAAYKIYRKTSSFTNVSASGVQLIDTITSKTTTSYDDTTATDDTEFYYAVTAIDTATPPNQLLTVTSLTGTSIDDKAPTTSDNIPVGWQTTPVTVTLTATDNGKGVNKTYYTTDGSNPITSDNKTQYSAPFTIGADNELGDGTWTIKYYSFDRNTTPNIEAIHTKTLKVDTSPPETTDNAPSGWENTTVTVTLIATDTVSGVSKTYYTKDGSTPTTASTEYQNPILFTTEGSRTLKYFSKDNASNTETINSVIFQIDTICPTSTITTLSTYSTTPINISWTSQDSTSGVDIVNIQVKNGTGNWTTWLTDQNATGSAAYTLAVNGNTYAFRSIATDVAGNTETDYSEDGDTSTTIAAGVPTALISTPSNADYVRQTVTFTGSAYDSGGTISGYWLNYSTDQSNWTTIATNTIEITSATLGTLDTTSLTEGSYFISLAVKAESGLKNWHNITLTIDNTPPTFSTISSSGISTSAATLSWTTNEQTNATIQYGTTTAYGLTKTQTTFTTSHSLQLTSLTSSTTYHYQIIMYDQAGNSNTTSDDNFTTSTASSGGGGGGGGGGLPPPPTNATDTPPTISNIYHEPETITYQDYVSIYATITDNHQLTSTKVHYMDGTTQTATMRLLNNNIYFAEIGPFSDGEQIEYYITATDNASQTTTSDTTKFTVVDGQGPTITILKPLPTTTIYDATPTIKIKYEDPSGIDLDTISLTLDDIDITSWTTRTTTSLTYTPTTMLSYATHYLSITVSDNLENSNTKSWKFTIEEADSISEEEIGNVTAGETVEVTPEDTTKSSIDKIDIITNNNLTDVKVTITTLHNQPQDTSNIPESKIVYSYLEIEATSEDEYLQQDDIQSLKISFKVPLNWFTNNDISPNDIVLLRHTNNSWNELNTSHLKDDTEFAYFEATTPGLSAFAIAATPPPPPPVTAPPSSFLAIIVVMLIAIIIVGYLYRRRVF